MRTALCRLAVAAAAGALLAPAPAVAQGATAYTILPGSRFEIRTTSEGLLAFAGDDHLIRAAGFRGQALYDPEEPARSRVELVIPTDSLRVLTPVDEGDRREIRRRMLEEVLRAKDHPDIRFRSRAVEAMTGDSLRVRGELTVAGTTRPTTVEIGTYLSGDTLRVFGGFDARLEDFGIQPPSVALGTVKVAQPIRFVVDAVLVRSDGGGPPGAASPFPITLLVSRSSSGSEAPNRRPPGSPPPQPRPGPAAPPG